MTLDNLIAENTKFICQLPVSIRVQIMVALLNRGIDGDNLTEAMSERACNIVEALRF